MRIVSEDADATNALRVASASRRRFALLELSIGKCLLQKSIYLVRRRGGRRTKRMIYSWEGLIPIGVSSETKPSWGALAVFALTPSPSPTAWERGQADKGTTAEYNLAADAFNFSNLTSPLLIRVQGFMFK